MWRCYVRGCIVSFADHSLGIVNLERRLVMDGLQSRLDILPHVIHPSLSPSSSFSISPATFEASSLSKPSEFYKWNNSSVMVSSMISIFQSSRNTDSSKFVQKRLIYHVNTLIYSLTSRCGGVFCSLTIIIASIISSNSHFYSVDYLDLYRILWNKLQYKRSICL